MGDTEQAGVPVQWIKPTDIGVHGNGRMMMLEKNNMEIAAVMSHWIEKALPSRTNMESKK
jgi:hypothetical protein